MQTISTSDAQESLARLIAETARSHEPVRITDGEIGAVLVGEDDWNALRETVFLLSVPGMRESIREGLATPASDCSQDPGW